MGWDRIANEQSDPLGDDMVDHLYGLQREMPFLDYKRIIPEVSRPDFPKIVKDLMAFANSSGGYLFIGVDENRGGSGTPGKFAPVGLPGSFVFEPASFNEKINSFTDHMIKADYRQFERTIDGTAYRFGVVYIEPTRRMISAKKDGKYVDPDSTKTRYAFRKGEIYVRRGTQSITASAYEIDQIIQRADQHDYRMSVLSGQPDRIEEKLYSNLFPVKRMPKTMYVGKPRFSSQAEANLALSKMPGFRVNLTAMSNGELYSFQRLHCGDSPCSGLVDLATVRRVDTRDVLAANKNIVLSLMNKEILACGARQGMHVLLRNKKLFYASNNSERRMPWTSRFRTSSRLVAKSMYAAQLGRNVFVHPAVGPSFVEVGGRFYLKLDPSIVLTEDGSRAIAGTRQGRVVTRLVYKSHNLKHLDNILFWIHQLGSGEDIALLDDFVISRDQVTTSCEYGISWDLQVGEIMSVVKNYKPETEQDELVIERV